MEYMNICIYIYMYVCMYIYIYILWFIHAEISAIPQLPSRIHPLLPVVILKVRLGARCETIATLAMAAMAIVVVFRV